MFSSGPFTKDKNKLDSVAKLVSERALDRATAAYDRFDPFAHRGGGNRENIAKKYISSIKDTGHREFASSYWNWISGKGPKPAQKEPGKSGMGNPGGEGLHKKNLSNILSGQGFTWVDTSKRKLPYEKSS